MKLEIRSFQLEDEQAIIELWKDCGLVVPWNDPLRDIRRKLKIQPEMFLVGCMDDKLIASVMSGYDGHRGWIYYLAVDPEFRNQNIGRQMVMEVEKLLRKAGCPKINLQVRNTNLEVMKFYKSLGFEEDNVIGLGKHLEEDLPSK